MGIIAMVDAATTNTIPMRINSDKMEFDYEEKIAYLRGHVVVRDKEGVLAADNATVYFNKKKNKGKEKEKEEDQDVSGFRRVVAVGNVRMSRDEQIVVSDKAVWNKDDNTIVLTGGPPMVREGTSYIKADKIVCHMDTKEIEFFPSPEIVFQVNEKDQAKIY